TSRVEPQSRGAGAKADARNPSAQGPEIEVAAEKSGNDNDEASVAARHALAAIDRIAAQRGDLCECERLARHHLPSRLFRWRMIFHTGYFLRTMVVWRFAGCDRLPAFYFIETGPVLARRLLLHHDAGDAVEERIESPREEAAEEKFRERDHRRANHDTAKDRIRQHEARSDLLQVLYRHDLGPSLGLNVARRKIEHGLVGMHHERATQAVGRDDRIAQRDVDSLRSDGRHRMRSVADQEQPRHGPLAQPIADGVEQERMRQAGLIRDEKMSQIGRHMRRECADPSVGANLFDIAKGSLVDHPSDLHVPFGRRIDDEQVAVADVGARGTAVEEMAGDMAPYDIEALHDAVLGEGGVFTKRRCAPVACDHEVAAIIARTLERVSMHAGHAIFFVDQIAHRYAALELEGRESCRLGNNHLEHRGLRHDARRRVEAVEWNGNHSPLAAKDLDRLNREIGQSVERLTKSGLVERRDARRHQDLAAKLARKISLSFE